MALVTASSVPSFVLYGEAPGELDERMLHIETIAARGRLHNWIIRPHLHRGLHQALLVTRGRVVARLDGSTTALRPPAMMLVPAGTVHEFEFQPGTQGFVASLTDELLREVAPRDAPIRALFDCPTALQLSAGAARATDLKLALQMLAREFRRFAPGRRAALEGLLIVVLANALRLAHTARDPAGEPAGRERLLVARFREQIEHGFRGGSSLASWCARLNVSPSRLRRACIEVAGESPIRLVHARQILEAKRQLLYTNMTVTEIAYALGFDDCAYFTRFFRRRTGMSPRAFRKCEARS